MDIADKCDICEDIGCNDCANCYLGNPCYGCKDYDRQTHICTSNGACGDIKQGDG